MTEKFTMKEKEKPICVVEICQGFCCRHISEGFAKMLKKFVTLIPNGQGELQCINVADNGKCEIYADRPLACKLFFCESAEMGYMRRAMQYIDNPTVSEVDLNKASLSKALKKKEVRK